MKLSLRSALLRLAQLGLSLRPLKESLRGLMPQPALVPIPIRAERRTRGSQGRPPYRDY